MTMISHRSRHTPAGLDPPALRQRVCEYFQLLQQRICGALEELDKESRFTEHIWRHREGGGGLTRVMEEGNVLERAGVNFSDVAGTLTEATARRMNAEPGAFSATGISLVLHPRSPLVPAVHANLRYFEQTNGDSWFGGGSDLTPWYPFDEDIGHFHTTLKHACDLHDPDYYPKFKKWCDEYFFLKHRDELRGVGGIFFDYLRGEGEDLFALVRSVGDAFLDAYLPIVRRRMNEPWGEKERAWQLLRRGRYVEFNLVYDKGTLFGLETHGRTESILMSLPPLVSWKNGAEPPAGSKEAYLIDLVKNPREWVV